MRKVAVASSLALAVVAAGALVPVYVGYKAKHALLNFQHAELGGWLIDHNIERYDSGYLTSRARGTMTVDAGIGPVELAVEHRIEHAFKPRVHTTFQLRPIGDSEVHELLYDVFGEQAFLTTDTRPSDAGWTMDVAMVSVEKPLPDGGPMLAFKGMSGELIFKDGAMNGSFVVQPLRLFDDDGGVEASAQRISFETGDAADTLATGSASYEIERLSVDSPEMSFALNDIVLKQSQTLYGEFFFSEAALRVRTAEIGERQIHDIKLLAKGERLHRELLDYLIQIGREHPSESALLNANFETVRPLVTRFLEQRPSMSVQLSFGPETDPTASLSWRLAYHQPSGMPVRLEQPELLIAGLDLGALATFKTSALDELVKLSDGELESIDELIDALAALEEEGYVVRDDAGYRIKLDFAKGELLINDAPRPEVLMMLAPFLAM